jgi:hypothetical protein
MLQYNQRQRPIFRKNKENMNIREGDEKTKYLLLKDAAKLSPYQQEYLSLLARRKHLKAIKINGNWHTTIHWLNDYIRKYRPQDLIQLQKKENFLKTHFLFFTTSTITILILMAAFAFLFNNEHSQTAQEHFIPNQRTILTDEQGHNIIYEVGTRVLGEETQKE